MDINTFEITCTGYKKVIGKYTIYIYIGTQLRTTSYPSTYGLALSQYSIVGVGVFETDKLYAYQPIDLSELGFNFVSPEGVYYYNLSITEMENVHNSLCELAGLPTTTNLPTIAISNGRKEKPCRCCGRMNDEGATPCWCCGADKPTS